MVYCKTFAAIEVGYGYI